MVIKQAVHKQAKPAPARERGAIDYPFEGELVSGKEYTVRVSAPKDADRVELCLNNGPWRPCRSAAGYWWLDCREFPRGDCQARARIHTPAGTALTLLRRFRSGW